MISPAQQKKLEKLAKVLDGGDVALLTELDALEDRLEGIAGQIPALREARDGDKGEKGDKGDSIKGDKGDRGPAGKDGRDGKDSTVQGPKGDKGDTGPMGPRGMDGIDGKDGEMGMVDVATIAYLEDEIKRVEEKIPEAVRYRETNFGMVVRGITAGRNMSVDSTDPNRPIVTNTNPKITISATEPADPVAGDIWIDTTA